MFSRSNQRTAQSINWKTETDGKTVVLFKLDQQMTDTVLYPAVIQGNGSIMLWSRFSSASRGTLIKIDWRMEGSKYMACLEDTCCNAARDFRHFSRIMT